MQNGNILYDKDSILVKNIKYHQMNLCHKNKRFRLILGQKQKSTTVLIREA